MRAKEFLNEESNLTYIERFVEKDWPGLHVSGSCMATGILFSIAHELNINLKLAFNWINDIVKKSNINLHSLPQVIELLENFKFLTHNGERINIKVSIFTPSVEEVILLAKADHPSVIIFDSSKTSPLMNTIMAAEEFHRQTGKWDGIIRPSNSEFTGYEYPPKMTPAHIDLANQIANANPMENIHHHAMLVIGYDAGQKVLICRDTVSYKCFNGYLKFPLDLIKYTKLLAFKATKNESN